MSSKLERLAGLLREKLGERVCRLELECGELNLDVGAGDYLAVALMLRDDPALGFEQLVDLSGIDYRDFAAKRPGDGRFAAVVHLLSVSNNWRLRLRAFAEDADFPVLESLVPVWPSANWYEREAFDLYGILFNGHPDLRRILTDYGFVGHPFRKDFPVTGYVEMRYDPEAGRVIYQPVSIEPRENTPRIVREDTYGDVGHG